MKRYSFNEALRFNDIAPLRMFTSFKGNLLARKSLLKTIAEVRDETWLSRNKSTYRVSELPNRTQKIRK